MLKIFKGNLKFLVTFENKLKTSEKIKRKKEIDVISKACEVSKMGIPID